MPESTPALSKLTIDEREILKKFSSFFKDELFEIRWREIYILPHETQGLSRVLKAKITGSLFIKNLSLNPNFKKENNRVYTSISHTKNASNTALVAIGSFQDIGIDLEFKNRVTHPKLSIRLISKSESHFDLSPLEHWIIKESAFKAYPKNNGTYLSHYQILKWNRKTRIGELQFLKDPKKKGIFKIIEFKNYYLAITKF